MHEDLKTFFQKPKTAKQRQYEALRAYVIEEVPAREAAQQFGFTETSLYALAHDLRTGELEIFPKVTTGPKERRVTPYIRDLICQMRREELSVAEIVERLKKDEKVKLGYSTVERIVKEAGFGKLRRRTTAQRGVSKKNTLLPETSHNLDLKITKPLRAECQVAGLFVFLPYIIESGILDMLDRLPLPESTCIGKKQAFLSFLSLKLMGGERLSHINQYDHDLGLGLFAGLNVLPKPTYEGTYSCLVSAQTCHTLQTELIACLRRWEPNFFSASTINLDFHSIPHFGEQSEMEKVWCGARGKALRGANTFFAQDAQSNVVLYANADVLRKDGPSEILRFVEHMIEIKGVVDETLVFDSRLTTYKILGELDKSNIKFITLRTRSKALEKQMEFLSEEAWQKVHLPIPKRKHQRFLAYESEVNLKGCPKSFRQIVMKEHGRVKPTYVITNNRDMNLTEILTVYARRWRIENKLAELVNFFNINALSSPLMVRIHFDLLLSVVASFLYSRLAHDLPRFEKNLPPDIFRRFIDMPGTIHFDGQKIEVRIRKRAHTPVLLGVEKLQTPVEIPWLDNTPLEIVYTP